MRALIARQLYQPALVLPLLVLTRLMVSHDFNLTQVMFVVMLKGSQQVYQFVLRHAALRQRASAAIEQAVCRHCC